MGPNTAICAILKNGYLICKHSANEINQGLLQNIAQRELLEVKRRKQIYLQNRITRLAYNQNVIVVEDGISNRAQHQSRHSQDRITKSR